MNARSSRNRKQKRQNLTTCRVVKLFSILSTILLQVNLSASFSLSSSSSSSSSLRSTIPASKFVPSCSAINRQRLNMHSCNRNNIRSTLTMSNADDDREFESDSSIITTSVESSNSKTDDDKNKIQNWFFALVLPLQLVCTQMLTFHMLILYYIILYWF